MVAVRRLEAVCRRPAGCTGALRPWRLAALGVACLALALAVGDALAQCARCSQPIFAAPGPSSSVPRNAGERSWRKEARRETRPQRTLLASGASTVCVRVCDGAFFPVTYIGAASRADSLEEVCRSLCPNAEVALYSFPFGGTIDEAVSAAGEPYARLPNAHKFEQSFDPGCSCRAPGQSWAEALAAAEAKYGHHSHDIFVTARDSERMSRPVQGAKTKPAADGRPDATAQVAPAPGLDINGVDTTLSAAAKTISRETSGIRDQDPERPVSFGLGQGETVEETDSEGAPRKVRVLPTTF